MLLLPHSSLGGKQTPWGLPRPFRNTGLLGPASSGSLPEWPGCVLAERLEPFKQRVPPVVELSGEEGVREIPGKEREGAGVGRPTFLDIIYTELTLKQQ